ncbi:M20 family metallopeptidase [Rubeoparvulum massiliense]|uniref:M20 family metallopeptidase n=1 Tax=Rubeoparvulum massiliense TaxID=1631346 RepID=UPI00065E2BD8|nr:M20 family metallopeptidase [Rubeoparvulum massiliense]
MKAYFEAHYEEMLDWLECLVNQDSGSSNKEGIDKLGTMLQKEYSKLGFQVEVLQEEKYGNHLRIRMEPKAGGVKAATPSILIIAHLDTVFPKGTAASRPFRIEGERGFGPGVIDMKGSQVMLLYVMKALLVQHDPAVQQIEILLNSDEEIGSPSSRPWTEELCKGKRYAIIMEPARANGAIVSARKGGGKYRLTVQGKAAHAGIEPEKGLNAIYELAHHVIQLQQLNGIAEGVTLNVGTFRGGTTCNTVPAEATAMVDIRVTTMEQMGLVAQRIEQLTSHTYLAGTKLQLEGGISRPPMAKTAATEAFLALVQQAGNELGIVVQDTFTGGGSDGNFTAALGVPTLDGLGPIGGNAHSEQEYIELSSLIERGALLARLLQLLV